MSRSGDTHIDPTRLTGLTPEQVAASRELHGSNVLTPVKGESVWKKLLEKFTGPFGHLLGMKDGDSLVFILEVVAILSITITCAEYWQWFGLVNEHGKSIFFEPVGILIAILLATGIAFIFEYKAEREFNVLNQVNDRQPVQVVRSGNTIMVPRSDVVVDDIVVLANGDEIPADGILLDSVSLNVDESTLTGEPSCHKNVNPSDDTEATYPSNMVLRGSKVIEGHGIFRVTAVGDSSEDGKLLHSVQIDDSVRTPLNEQLDRLSRWVTIISYVVALGIVVGRVVMMIDDRFDDWVAIVTYLLESVMIAITLIVVAVPEGLPMAVTLSLAYSMRRMLRTNNLVRRMHACETMGAATVICTDKTGTLTQNKMQVYRTVFPVLGEAQQLAGNASAHLIVQAMALNSTARLDFSDRANPMPLGNPTECALLLWLNSQGVDYREARRNYRRVAEVPFSTERKFMATVIEDKEGNKTLHVKGAPEIIFGKCREVPQNLKEQLVDYQNRAMRTLAFATAKVEKTEDAVKDCELTDKSLTLLGIVAISDPVREDVPEAVAQCRQADIKVKVVTGDTVGTAREIAREIGLWNDVTDGERNIITGSDFEKLTDAELDERVGDFKVIARARPLDKKRLVEALQRRGEVVAVTGDGTNDAPALKVAHVGLSMGNGTAVAREASDITIIDNSFTSIGKAVMWGRSLYRNIQRFILFQLTVNVTACLVVLVGAFMGKDSPLTVTQMLWVNLIMDTFAAMALASLPPTSGVMMKPPRKRTSFIINKSMAKRIVIIGLIFAVLLIGLFYILEHNDIDSFASVFKFNHAGNTLTRYELSLFFTVFVMLQFWNLFNAKALFSRHSAFRGILNCRFFVIIAMIIFAGQILIVQFGGEMFNVCPLSMTDWVYILVATSPVLIIGETIRLLQPKKR